MFIIIKNIPRYYLVMHIWYFGNQNGTHLHKPPTPQSLRGRLTPLRVRNFEIFFIRCSLCSKMYFWLTIEQYPIKTRQFKLWDIPQPPSGAWHPSGVKISKSDPRGFDMALKQCSGVNMAILLKWEVGFHPGPTCCQSVDQTLLRIWRETGLRSHLDKLL